MEKKTTKKIKIKIKGYSPLSFYHFRKNDKKSRANDIQSPVLSNMLWILLEKCLGNMWIYILSEGVWDIPITKLNFVFSEKNPKSRKSRHTPQIKFGGRFCNIWRCLSSIKKPFTRIQNLEGNSKRKFRANSLYNQGNSSRNKN